MRKTTFMLSLAALTLASCLDESPRDQVDRDEIYNSANDIYVNAVASLYGYFGSNTESEGLQGTCRGVFDYNTLTTDEAMNPIRGGDWYDGGLWENMYQHRWTASDTYIYNVWKYLYKVIVLCNQSLEVIETRQTLLSEAQRRSYNAEVRAVRAMFYWYAMDLFGRIPIVTGTSESISGVRQSERSEVLRFVFSELSQTAPLLDNAHSNLEGDHYGRLTRPVAYFILAKLALNAEVYCDDNWTDGTRQSGSDITFTVDGQTMNAWETCQHYCRLISECGYTLEQSYASNFAVHNETSCENILTIPMDKELYQAEYHYVFRSLHYKHGGALSRGSENGTCATIAAMNAYGYGTSSPDPRMAINLYTDTVYVDGAKVLLDNGKPLVYQPMDLEVNLTFSKYIQTAGARIAKYAVDRTAYADGKLSNNDIVLFRYADVLLMWAEAKVRNGEDGSAELNAVRDRAGVARCEATLDNILNERLRELYFEGWRRQDLIRYGKFHLQYDLRTPSDNEQDGHTTVFPIPQKCLDLNSGLDQNPGYGS